MLREDGARFYADELLTALKTLHNIGVIYRDINPENIFFNEEADPLSTDYGLGKEFIGSAEINNS